ncbi:hypothetical protein C8J56DRAFT_30816 [Mycena floridula]|nr:hypothetical protein C8J56DRAFT_30816 [Mycena floridula]
MPGLFSISIPQVLPPPAKRVRTTAVLTQFAEFETREDYLSVFDLDSRSIHLILQTNNPLPAHIQSIIRSRFKQFHEDMELQIDRILDLIGQARVSIGRQRFNKDTLDFRQALGARVANARDLGRLMGSYQRDLECHNDLCSSLSQLENIQSLIHKTTLAVSPIRRLQPEPSIIAEIMGYLKSNTLDQEQHVWTMTQVCRSWRDIIPKSLKSLRVWHPQILDRITMPCLRMLAIHSLLPDPKILGTFPCLVELELDVEGVALTPALTIFLRSMPTLREIHLFVKQFWDASCDRFLTNLVTSAVLTRSSSALDAMFIHFRDPRMEGSKTKYLEDYWEKSLPTSAELHRSGFGKWLTERAETGKIIPSDTYRVLGFTFEVPPYWVLNIPGRKRHNEVLKKWNHGGLEIYCRDPTEYWDEEAKVVDMI